MIGTEIAICPADNQQEKTMRKFKNNVSEGWLFKQELRFFRNFMRNWDRDVDDCDFFDIFANSNNTNGNETKTMLKRHFSLEELGRCDGI